MQKNIRNNNQELRLYSVLSNNTYYWYYMFLKFLFIVRLYLCSLINSSLHYISPSTLHPIKSPLKTDIEIYEDKNLKMFLKFNDCKTIEERNKKNINISNIFYDKKKYKDRKSTRLNSSH